MPVGVGDALRASAAAELGKWHTTPGGHVDGDLIEVAFSQRIDDHSGGHTIASRRLLNP
jgi:hypothetical protein